MGPSGRKLHPLKHALKGATECLMSFLFSLLLAGYDDIDRLLVATMIYFLVTGIEVIGPSKQGLK